MTVIVAAGVAVLVLGAVVLLRFPDRPGGKIAWHGAEVSSIGAGMPLIVVGLVAVALGSGVGREAELSPFGAATTNADTPSCADALAGIPAERVSTVAVGAKDQVVLRPDQPKREPFALLLEDAGKRLGTLRASYVTASGIFILDVVLDGVCRPATVANVTSPAADPMRPPTYSDLRLGLGEAEVVLELKGGVDVRVDLSRFTP